MSLETKTKKIFSFIKIFFATLRPTKPTRIFSRSTAGKRAAFLVLMAGTVIVLSANFAFAEKIPGTPPAPGSAFSTWTPAWQNAPGASAYVSSGAPSVSFYNSSAYQNFLMNVGGYSVSDAASAMAQYRSNNSIIPSPMSAASSLGDKAANVIKDFLAGTAGNIALGILAIIVQFCKLLVDLSANFLKEMLRPDIYNLTQETMIVKGWTIVRDICNLFFLIILLFIAICTILQVEKYHAKKTLLTLILMALLINFSKPIAIFIFDGSQLLMNMLLKANGNKPDEVIAYISRISEMIYQGLPGFKAWINSNNSINMATQYLFATVFLFVLAIALFTTALFLLIRIVAIWILIIISPLAFLATTIPDFRKMASNWWSALFSYSYYGPAAAFFLFLATFLVNSGFLKTFTYQNDTIVSMQSFVSFMVVIIFLYASIIMGKQFGLALSNGIVGWADKSLKGGWFRKGGWPREIFAWGSRTSGISGAVSQKVGTTRLGKYFTKEGRKTAQEEREAGWAETFGVKGAKDKLNLKKMAEKTKKWKDEGILDDEIELRRLLTSGNDIEKMAAARELAKNGKLENGAQYKAGLDALAPSPALLDAYRKDAKKKNIHAVIDEEITRTGATGAAAQAVYDKHLDSIKPAELGDQNLDAFRDPYSGNFRTEFNTWANAKLPTIHMGIKNDLAKKLNTKDLADFTASGWV